MKMSIAWIFDHIDANWRDYDIAQLVTLFNQKTAEIEAFYPIRLDIEHLFLATVVSVAQETVELQIKQTGQTIELPKRDKIKEDDLFIVRGKDSQWRWATCKDFHSSKPDLLPAVSVDQDLVSGEWKKNIDVDDYIIEVDNKSITHRPDLWSHYGFAREVAILLGLPLKSLALGSFDVQHYAHASKAQEGLPFVVHIQEPHLIKRYACTYITAIENRPSLLWMTSRLCRIDAKPIDMVVDMTNYVMFDVGQPLHAFDAEKIESDKIESRLAKSGESIALLDGQIIELTNKDIVIADGRSPLALAGIMGGQDSAVSLSTQEILLEAANFDATTVRISGAHHKKRTESSARFEKTLDPNQTVIGIERFLTLLKNAHVAYHVSPIINVGSLTHPLQLIIEHAYIQERLGTSIDSEAIISILELLGCAVKWNGSDEKLSYHVTVPTFRSTKDIKIKEDLLEEIGRLYGYTNIPFVLPRKETKPANLTILQQQRAIKQFLSFGVAMHEVKNYAFFNESFLQLLQWQPERAVTIESPVSEQYKTLATSLVPGLLSNVYENHAEHDKLRFFEWARRWQKTGNEIIERSELAGIFYNKKEMISFYEIKGYMQHLFAMLQLSVTWHKVDNPQAPWFAPYQTAYVKCNDRVVATVGIVDVGFVHHLMPGSMALFVIDGTFLDACKHLVSHFSLISKYPAVERDISMMIPQTVTVEQLSRCIASSNNLIIDVQLIDFFEKPEWKGQRSVAFRFVMQDRTKTLTHQEIDQISLQVNDAVKALGAEIR
jgi:phenylalanyl-tRNA synthetase beta chain